MQLSVLHVFSAMLALGSAVTGQDVTVYFETGYDDPNRPLGYLSCADGPHGLVNKYGWHYQGQIPYFPHIGGAQAVAGWNSPECGSCWMLMYRGNSIKLLAVDHTAHGFSISKSAMNHLTGGRAELLGKVQAQFFKLNPKACGV